MSSVVCPEGHRSTSTDYCDVCGAPISASGAPVASSAPQQPTAAAPTTCPHCESPAAAGALFCENCGYDFTTGATPTPAVPVGQPSAATGAHPVVTPSGRVEPPAPENRPTTSGPTTSDPTTSDPASAPVTSDPAASDPVTGGAVLPTPAPDGPDSWVAEVWIDPDWYRLQAPEDPMPSAGLPVLVPLRTRSVLVGRPSVSRNIHPNIDCGADSGVSRRHCQLNTDGTRWWVEDLQSSNGTYVAPVGAPLPQTPVPAGQRHELADGDRVYVGAWTRIVVRRALPGEL